MKTKKRLPKCPKRGWKWATGTNTTRAHRFISLHGEMENPPEHVIGTPTSDPILVGGFWVGYIRRQRGTAGRKKT